MSDVSAAAASRKVRAASEVPDREDDSDEVTIFYKYKRTGGPGSG